MVKHSAAGREKRVEGDVDRLCAADHQGRLSESIVRENGRKSGRSINSALGGVPLGTFRKSGKYRTYFCKSEKSEQRVKEHNRKERT